MTYLLVALGSALGGVGRYWLGNLMSAQVGGVFPWGTLLVNVLGSFVIGLAAALTAGDGRLPVAVDARQFVMIGLCGGFTTFSAFSLQTLTLIRAGDWGFAATNIVLSVVLCLAGVALGHFAGHAINRSLG